MAKAKVKDIKGIYTYVDEGGASLEVLKDSTNFKFEPGYSDIEYPALKQDETVPSLPTGYIWERGISTVLTSDILSEADTSFRKVIMVLIAITEVAPYTRKVYIREEGGSWTTTLDMAPWIFESMLTTEIEGTTQFAEEDGRLKIYMPHDSFWLGYIDREIYLPGLTTINSLYFDKLIDDFSFNVENAYDSVIGVSPALNEGYRIGLINEFSEVKALTEIEGDPIRWEYIETQVIVSGSRPAIYQLFKMKNLVSEEYIPTDQETVYPHDVNEDKSLIWWFREGLVGGSYLFADETKSKIWYVDLKPLTGSFNTITQDGYAYFDINELKGSNADKWEYVRVSNPAADGTGFTESRYEFITTLVLDEKSEIVVDHFLKEDITEIEYAIKIKTTLAPFLNKRVTRIAHYVRFDKVSDFEKVGEFNFLDSKRPMVTLYITTAGLSGVYLASRIGMAINPEEENYNLIQGIRDREMQTGYAVVISYKDPAHIQFNAIGGGKIMTDIFYFDASLEIEDVTNTIALRGANGKIFLISNHDTKVLNIDGIGGSPVFILIDTLEYGIRDWQDAVEVQGGILLHTQEGIYLTNGYDKELVSNPINDIIIDNYDTARIFYNKFKHELYYFEDPINNGTYYTFSFRRKKWEKRDTTLTNVSDVLQLYDGEIAYLATKTVTTATTEKIWVEGTGGTSQIITGTGVYGDPFILYNADHIMLVDSGIYTLSSFYKLGDNIDMTGKDLPRIGNYITPFTGDWDGDFYTISNMNYTITSPATGPTESGFFGNIFCFNGVNPEDKKHVRNMRFKDCNIVNHYGTNLLRYVGILAGRMVPFASVPLGDAGIDDIHFINCSISFTGTGSTSYNGLRSGIVCGQSSTGPVSGIRVDSDCVHHSTATYQSSGKIGGLMSLCGSNIKESCFQGTVTTTAQTWVEGSGLIHDTCNLEDCYFSGTLNSVSTNYNNWEQPIFPTMGAGITQRVYAAATYSAGGDRYAFTRNGPQTAYTPGCYYDSTLAGGGETKAEANLNAEITADMKTQGTYLDYDATPWDFTNTWTMTGDNGGYPDLRRHLAITWKEEAPSTGGYWKDIDTITVTTTTGLFEPTTDLIAFVANIESNKTNLGESSIEKYINHVDINYIGEGTLKIYGDRSTVLQEYDLASTTRRTDRMFISLINRVPLEKFRFYLETSDKDFILYDIELDFDLEEKDSGFGPFPIRGDEDVDIES